MSEQTDLRRALERPEPHFATAVVTFGRDGSFETARAWIAGSRRRVEYHDLVDVWDWAGTHWHDLRRIAHRARVGTTDDVVTPASHALDALLDPLAVTRTHDLEATGRAAAAGREAVLAVARPRPEEIAEVHVARAVEVPREIGLDDLDALSAFLERQPSTPTGTEQRVPEADWPFDDDVDVELAVDVATGILLRIRAGRECVAITEATFDVDIPDERFDPRAI